jgi:hypothetical protein
VESLGIVRENLLVKGEKKEERLSVLFDSGSARSLIKSEVAKEFTTPRELPTLVEVTVADGHKVGCRYYCNLIVEIGQKRIVIQPLLVDGLPVPLVFGALDMEAYMIKLDLAKRRLDLSEFTGYMLAI